MTGFDSLPERLRDLPPTRRYLIGVSGGRDSVALLHWLVRHGYHRLIVCHLDHGLRGRASRGDALFVRRLAEKWKLSSEVGREEVTPRAARTKQSIEAAGRAARLEFFARIARRRRCLTIFLAHHADDQVETFLMQLFRGTGGRGSGAMREVSDRGPLQILRPMLGIWRAEIDDYVAQHRLKFREDATNENLGPRRNLWRREILPELERQLGRSLRKNLWRTANVLAEEDAFLETLLPNEPTLEVKKLRALPLVLQRRLILRWMREQAIADVGFELIENVRRLSAPGTRAVRTNLPRNRFVRRKAGHLVVE